jgi:hypothetical protein
MSAPTGLFCSQLGECDLGSGQGGFDNIVVVLSAYKTGFKGGGRQVDALIKHLVKELIETLNV